MVLIFTGINRSFWGRLILLFLFSFYFGCDHKSSDAEIIWEDGRAVGISIPRQFFRELSDDSIRNLLEVRLSPGNSHAAILGEYDITRSVVIFRPLISFTRGLTYVAIVSSSDSVRFAVPPVDHGDRPVISGVYPTQDTLPSNLLKIYLHFSQPMQTGRSLQYISVVKNKKDTVPDVFLDLQPELWNYDRTVLTLWLDPGRIKRDLQPNLKLGMPLLQASAYSLLISAEWSDSRGSTLQQGYQKDFYVTERDTISPDPARWILAAPKANTKDPVVVDFREALDYTLLMEAIQVTDHEGNAISGTAIPKDGESVYQFFPQAQWSKGTYFLRSEARLEDLSGNNLNRPFDRDVSSKPTSSPKESFSRTFQIN